MISPGIFFLQYPIIDNNKNLCLLTACHESGTVLGTRNITSD